MFCVWVSESHLRNLWLTLRRLSPSCPVSCPLRVLEQVLERHRIPSPGHPLSIHTGSGSKEGEKWGGSGRTDTEQRTGMSVTAARGDAGPVFAEMCTCRLLATMTTGGAMPLPRCDLNASCCLDPGTRKGNYLSTERSQRDCVGSAHPRASALLLTSQPCEKHVEK